MFFQIFIPIVVYSVAIALIAISAHFLHVRLKNRKLKKALKKQSKVKNQAIVKQKSKEITYAKKINCLHTADNYSTIYSAKKNKYCKLKAFTDKLIRKIDTNQGNQNTKKKIKKANGKIETLAQTYTNSEKLSPDWVRQINENKLDKTTYIQCYDEEIANKFEDFTNKNYQDSAELPYVCQMEYSSKDQRPLIVSSADKKVFNQGVELLCEKIKNVLDDTNSLNAQDIFPLTVKIIQAKKENCKTITIQNIEELNELKKQINTENNIDLAR